MTWLRNWSRSARPEAYLLCLPPAGGAAHLYRRWPRILPERLGVVAVELPGHGSRMDEAPIPDLDLLVRLLADEVTELTDRPLVVFGHSMGAVVGFETCRELRRRIGWLPTGFVAAGCEAPNLLHTRDYATRMTDDGMDRFLRETGGTPASLMSSPEFLDMLRPLIRADLGMLAARVHRDEPALDRPLRVYLGATDATIDPAKARDWQREASADFSVHVFPGGHFFTQEAEPIVLARLAHDVRALVAGEGVKEPAEVA